MNDKTETAAETSIVSKLTPAVMKFNPGRAKVDDKKVLLGRVYGIASGVKQVKAGNGDVHFALTGDFRGVNSDTGINYRSGVLYLPAGIHDMLQAAVDGGLDENGKPIYRDVKFGIDLFAAPAKNPIGYSYEATSVIKAVEADPLAELEAEMNEAKPLPTPKTK
jgi:hypothetical protein